VDRTQVKIESISLEDCDFGNVPQELKALDQWVCHIGKVPYNPKTGRRANPADPKTGATFDSAINGLAGSQYDGAGYSHRV